MFGCVTRTITVRTNPSNALVYIDDKLVGESPVTIPFTYYGTRKITIEKRDADGKLIRKRETVFEKIKPPIYQIFPLDFVSEFALPFNMKDDHILNYDLVELEPLSRKEMQKKVLDNAEELRQKLYSPDF
ncbi:MAG: PEGA domain-containing protein [Candidatus Scalinduaceae bacterium]